jgi:hypothetical protein
MAEEPTRQERFQAISRQKAEGVTQAELARRDGQNILAVIRAELGFLGRFFGSKENAPTYIAAVFGAMCLLYIILSSAFLTDREPPAIRDFIGPVLIAIVGFLFGRGSRN